MLGIAGVTAAREGRAADTSGGEACMRTTGLGRALVVLSLVAAPAAALAQSDYPTKPVRIVVGFAPGGGNDIFARIIATKMTERTGWTVVIENKAGAGGRLAADHVATQPADGHTVLIGASGAMAIGPIIYKVNYSTLKSFAPVTMIAEFPLFLVVRADHPAHSVKELVAWTKANPDKANYATSSPAFTLPTELFKMRTGAQGVGIPYKSSGESLMGIIAGNATMTIVDPPPATPQVQAGKLRALAVTGKTRSRELPDVPTMTEAGIADVTVGLWSGFFVPTGTPRPIIDRLAREFREVILNTDVKDKLLAMGVEPVGSSPEEFTRHIDGEIRMWEAVVKEGNLKFSD
jgi:tripartite-type tricarboxylate transporter receptor subunit TctC